MLEDLFFEFFKVEAETGRMVNNIVGPSLNDILFNSYLYVLLALCVSIFFFYQWIRLDRIDWKNLGRFTILVALALFCLQEFVQSFSYLSYFKKESPYLFAPIEKKKEKAYIPLMYGIFKASKELPQGSKVALITLDDNRIYFNYLNFPDNYASLEEADYVIGYGAEVKDKNKRYIIKLNEGVWIVQQ